MHGHRIDNGQGRFRDEAATADAADDDAMMKRRYRRSRGPSRPRKRNVWGGIGSGGYDGDGGSDSGRTSTWSSSYRRTTTSTPSGGHLPTNISSRRLQGLRAGISMTHLCISCVCLMRVYVFEGVLNPNS